MATEAEQEEGVGLDISWKHTKDRRKIKIKLGDSRATLSHPMTEDGAADITVLAQVLPAVLEQVRAAIESQEAEANDIDR